MNGLLTAPLDKLESLTLHNEQRYALVVVAASLNNTTPFQEYRDLQAGTVEEAFFAVDWRLIYAMLRPLLTQLDSFDLVIISKQIARAGSQSDYGCGVKWVQQLLKLVSQERLGMEAPPLVRYVLCIDEFTTLLDALWKKVMAQKRNKDECKSVLESFGTNIVANYLHDQSRVLLSGFTEDTKTFATASGRQSWPVYLDVLRDVDLMPGSQYGAFVQRIVLHLHDTFTEDNIVTWFRDNAVALRKAKVNSSDLVQHCCHTDTVFMKALSDEKLCNDFSVKAGSAVKEYMAKVQVNGVKSAGLESVRHVFRGWYLPHGYLTRFSRTCSSPWHASSPGFSEICCSTTTYVRCSYVPVGTEAKFLAFWKGYPLPLYSKPTPNASQIL
eukprot:PhM_4_TR1734/c0_g1_i8/m.86868